MIDKFHVSEFASLKTLSVNNNFLTGKIPYFLLAHIRIYPNLSAEDSSVFSGHNMI